SVQTEFHAHTRENFTAAFHHIFFHFEFWNTESQQPPNFWTFIKDHRFYPVTHQNIRTAKSCRTCPDNRDFLIGPLHIGHIWTPAQSKGGIIDRKSTRLNSSHVK